MKILVFLPTHTLTIERGDTTHIKELISNLSKLAEIDVIKASDTTASERVPLTIKALRIMRGLAKGSFSILKRRPDLLYTRSGQAIFAFLLAKIFRLPMILEINGLSIDEWRMEGGTSGINRWISYNKDLLNDKTYKYADHLVVVTPKIKEVLQIEYKINPEKISVIENGANTELFRPTNTNEARRELKLNETHNYICFVGTLYKWQGVEYLIKASPYILEECPQSSFLVIGDGPSHESLTKLAEQLGVSDKFIFTGMVPYEKVPLYINSSDICVVPRPPIKGSPLKLYEYMACGKPVIASDLEGIREILVESNAGICVPAESPRELADAIVGLLRAPKSRDIMGKNGRRHIVENRSWESVAKTVFEVCQMVVQKH
jgi:glycosyltransferase involved in cell wall biosynthesis